MTKFDDIYEDAVDNFGLISSAHAVELGITNNELVQYARRGKLERVGQGLYRLSRRVPEENDPYALAVALVGPGAFLFGESVIAMLHLAPTNPNRLYVATARRIRRKLPDGLVVVKVPPSQAKPVTVYEGVPSQTAHAAISSCVGRMMPSRLLGAAEEARRQGYVNAQELDELKRELEDEEAQQQA